MIRKAEIKDIPDLIPIAKMAIKEMIPASLLPLNDESIQDFLTRSILNPDVGYFVWDDDDIIKGVVGVSLSPFWGNYDIKLSNHIHWYVLPKFRKTRIGLALFKYSEHWAMRNGARVLTTSHLVGKDSIRRFYERHGYEDYNQTYIKRVP